MRQCVKDVCVTHVAMQPCAVSGGKHSVVYALSSLRGEGRGIESRWCEQVGWANLAISYRLDNRWGALISVLAPATAPPATVSASIHGWQSVAEFTTI